MYLANPRKRLARISPVMKEALIRKNEKWPDFKRGQPNQESTTCRPFSREGEID
jgi:hypothetical protein